MADIKNINPRRPIPNNGYDRLRQNLSQFQKYLKNFQNSMNIQ